MLYPFCIHKYSAIGGSQFVPISPGPTSSRSTCRVFTWGYELCIGCVKSPPCSGYIVQSQSDRIGNLARVLLIVQMLVCNTLLIWGNNVSVKIGYTRSSWFLMVYRCLSMFIDVYRQFPIFTLFIDGNNWRAIEPSFHRRTASPQEQCTWSQGIAASGRRFLGVVSGSASWCRLRPEFSWEKNGVKPLTLP